MSDECTATTEAHFSKQRSRRWSGIVPNYNAAQNETDTDESNSRQTRSAKRRMSAIFENTLETTADASTPLAKVNTEENEDDIVGKKEEPAATSTKKINKRKSKVDTSTVIKRQPPVFETIFEEPIVKQNQSVLTSVKRLKRVITFGPNKTKQTKRLSKIKKLNVSTGFLKRKKITKKAFDSKMELLRSQIGD